MWSSVHSIHRLVSTLQPQSLSNRTVFACQKCEHHFVPLIGGDKENGTQSVTIQTIILESRYPLYQPFPSLNSILREMKKRKQRLHPHAALRDKRERENRNSSISNLCRRAMAQKGGSSSPRDSNGDASEVLVSGEVNRMIQVEVGGIYERLEKWALDTACSCRHLHQFAHARVCVCVYLQWR